MSEVPVRLVVISARVPEGESCFVDGERCQLLDASERCGAFGWPTDGGYRLPECRERDGWVAYPPDTIEALRAALGSLDYHAHRYIQVREDKATQDYAKTLSDMNEARKDVIEAARKVAGGTP